VDNIELIKLCKMNNSYQILIEYYSFMDT